MLFIMAAQNVNFKLKRNTPGKPSPIYLILYFDKTRFKYSTGQIIDPLFWNNETQRPFLKQNEKGLTLKLNPDIIRDNERINFSLNEFQSATQRYFENLTFNREQPTPERLKEMFDKDFRQEQKRKEPKKIDLNTYIENYIKELETGKRLTEKDKKRYSPGTIKNFKGFQVQFNNYQNEKHKKLNFENITIDFYNDYTGYFTQKDYSLNTIGRHVKNLKTIMRAARDEGLHQNNEIDRKHFKILKTDVDSIYLTEKEIQDIYKLDLAKEPVLDLTRDIFLVGCYTAQRFSDYSRINKTHIRELENGTRIIELRQQKTGERVIIPIKPELLQILKKYNYNLPKTYEQKINENIKKVGSKAKITDKQEIETIKGGLTVKNTISKNQLIKTHTARRTGATLMYLSGIPSIDIMKITGHKTEREFLKYIKVTKEQTAVNMALHPYFQSAHLKIIN
jgi:integrase